MTVGFELETNPSCWRVAQALSSAPAFSLRPAPRARQVARPRHALANSLLPRHLLELHMADVVLHMADVGFWAELETKARVFRNGGLGHRSDPGKDPVKAWVKENLWVDLAFFCWVFFWGGRRPGSGFSPWGGLALTQSCYYVLASFSGIVIHIHYLNLVIYTLYEFLDSLTKK